MTKFILHFHGWVLLCTLLCIGLGRANILQADTTAFIDVTVIPMDSLYILPNYTVIVENDKITNMGPNGIVEIPEQAQRFECHGKFLMPGLADMHIHTLSDSTSYQKWVDLKELILFIANGITTVRNMAGDTTGFHLRWRERIKNCEILGPTLYTTCPIIDLPPTWPGSLIPKSSDDARQIVRQQESLGYDFIKVYDNLTIEMYDAIISEAKNQNIPVVGHIPRNVGVEHTILSGQKSIEHLGYGMKISGWGTVWENVDSTKRNETLSQIVQSGIWICPTLTVFKRLITRDENLQEILKYVPRDVVTSWKHGGLPPDQALVTFNTKLLTALYDAGANILLGTDCCNPYTVPGFSIHEELKAFVEAGFTPYEAIRTGTYNAASFVGALDEFGTIAENKRADLILLNKNPLDDVKNIQDCIGVMVRGKWYTEEQLQDSLKMLEERWNLNGIKIDRINGQEPSHYSLYQNYPNPFNSTTIIEFDLPKPSHNRLVIYNLLGRQVRILINTRQQAGRFRTTWNGTDDHNLPVDSGVYFYRMESEDFIRVNKLLLIK